MIEENNKITILEVKSGDNYRKHSSLDAVVSEYNSKINRAIVLSKFNLSQDHSKGIIYLPLYMTMLL